jgi:acetyl esterase/lipase
MRKRTLSIAWMLLFVPFLGLGQDLKPSPDPWLDYASGQYDIRPNIVYATANNTALKLDLYLPRNRTTPVPTLVFFHGGGWVAGQKEQEILHLLPYLSLGWGVVNVEYRMASNSPAPAAVEDCRCALRWVEARAKVFNFDTSRIVLSGGSAGGHLALITGILPANSIFDRQCPTNDSVRWNSGTEPRIKVAAIVNWFGITDVEELLDGSNAKHYAIEWFGSMNNRNELAKELSPLSYVRPGLPPIITIHGDKDNIVPYSQAVRLHVALDKVGVPNQLVTIHNGGHDGFSQQELSGSFNTIREFLRKNHLLSNEASR